MLSLDSIGGFIVFGARNQRISYCAIHCCIETVSRGFGGYGGVNHSARTIYANIFILLNVRSRKNKIRGRSLSGLRIGSS